MVELKDLIKFDDWKKEKHVPVIRLQKDVVKKGEYFEVEVSVGKEIPHPNTTEHHIRWIVLFFMPENEEFPYQVARVEFNSHGESVAGPNTSTVYTDHTVKVNFKTEKHGTILASSYCNIHGLWQSSKNISVK